jgi:ankyrin repeat protein
MIESADFDEENTFIAKSNHPDECFDRNTSKLMLEDVFRHGPTFMKLTDVLQSKIIIDCTGNENDVYFTEILAENIWTGLMCACFHGCTNIIELLLNAKADASIKDSDGLSALMICCAHNQCDSIKVLIKFREESTNGADIDINAFNLDGCTSLMYACSEGHINVIDLLLYSSADASIKDNDGKTALMICCIYNQCNSLKTLIKFKDESKDGAGIDIDGIDKDGMTSLMYACSCGHKEIVELLLSCNADLTIENHIGKNAQSLASDFKEIQNMIEDALSVIYILK